MSQYQLFFKMPMNKGVIHESLLYWRDHKGPGDARCVHRRERGEFVERPRLQTELPRGRREPQSGRYHSAVQRGRRGEAVWLLLPWGSRQTYLESGQRPRTKCEFNDLLLPFMMTFDLHSEIARDHETRNGPGPHNTFSVFFPITLQLLYIYVFNQERVKFWLILSSNFVHPKIFSMTCSSWSVKIIP